MPPQELRKLACVVERLFLVSSEGSWQLADISEDWKKTHVNFIFRKGKIKVLVSHGTFGLSLIRQLNIRINFSAVSEVKHWYSLLGDAVESPSLDMPKTQPGNSMSNLL